MTSHEDDWTRGNPIPAVLLFVGVVAFLIGVCWMGFAR